MSNHPQSRRFRSLATAALLAGCLLALPLHAQDMASFYAGHKLTIGVPNGVGGLYDIYVRALSRHMGKYIPGNPAIIVQDVPAGGGMVLANQLYATAPKDGSYLGMVRGTVVQEQVYQNPQVQFDARRFAWIGNMNSDYDTCIAWTGRGIDSIADLYAREAIVGASGVGAQSYSFPTVYREMLGMKFKVISGYPGTPERILAMERGELTGACGVSSSSFRSQFGQLVGEGKVRLIAQAGAHKDPRYPQVPNMLEEAKTPEVRQALEFLFLPLALGRALAAPPETPKERLAVLRQALMQTMKDPEFLEDAGKLKIDIEPADAEQTAAMVERLFATPPAVVARIQAALGL